MTGISGAAAAAGSGCHVTNPGRHGSDSVVCSGGTAGAIAVAGLGLVDPGVEQALIAPVIVRELTAETNGPRRRIELLAGQAAMAEQVSQRNVASAEVLFETALGLVYGGEVFHIEGFVVERLGGWRICTGWRRWHRGSAVSSRALSAVRLLSYCTSTYCGLTGEICRQRKTVFIWRCGSGWRR